MGKGQKGKGKPAQRPNNKFKKRSPENLKQLAKVDRILQGRSPSASSKKGRQEKPANRKKPFGKGNGTEYSVDKRINSNQPRRNNDWSDRGDRKTKQIGKPTGGSKAYKQRYQDDQQEKIVMPKGNPLFKIIPQNMDSEEDEFAAMDEGSSDQVEFDGQQVEGQQLEGQQEIDEQGQRQQVGDQQDEQEIAQEEQDQENQEQFDDEQDDKDSDDQNDPEQVEQQNVKDQQAEQGDQNQLEQQQNDKQPVDISVISLKIQQTIQILMNVQRLGAGKPRKHYIEEMKKLIHKYYGYNFQLIGHFLDFFNPSEMIQFFEANETHRPLTIRTNTLKTRRKELAQCLIQRGVNLDPLADWSKVGIKIYQTKVPIGATPEYLAGQYMLQSASSLLPVIALDPQVGEKILDMASAPGGKTTYIAQLMKNTGCLFANDLKKERLRALQFNLYRLGITNTAVTCRDGRKFPLIFPGTFDRVLLDAPCTGLGIISKDHSIKANRLMIDIYKNSHLQKQLLLAAIDCCKVNGVVVYSTCSVSPLQNEEVVNYALKRRFIKIVECEIEVGEQGLTKFVDKRFHVDLKKTRRIYPHVHNMDGFYVAKLVKVSKGKKQVKQQQNQGKQERKMMGDYQPVQIDQ